MVVIIVIIIIIVISCIYIQYDILDMYTFCVHQNWKTGRFDLLKRIILSQRIAIHRDN